MRRAVCLLLAAACLLLCACAAAPAPAEDAGEPVLTLRYAQTFTVEKLTPDVLLLTVAGKDRYVLLQNGAVPDRAWADCAQIRIPVERVCLASSSVADLFVQMDALDAVGFTATRTESWTLPELAAAQEAERILFAGKSSTPDYELLLTEGCDLVVENTMILHNPDTKEKLEELGLPVLVEYSSYEPHPLGRVEWIKLYGLLTGHLAEAEAFFDRQAETLEAVTRAEASGKTVAFFHITSSGSVVVRKRADYITRMIELAGGETALTDLPADDTALSTVNLQMESFYAQARDADVLIYNSTVAGDVTSVDQLLALSTVLADFKAVRTGNVWCTEQSMFQRSSAAADMIADIHNILSDSPDEGSLKYLHRIQ